MAYSSQVWLHAWKPPPLPSPLPSPSLPSPLLFLFFPFTLLQPLHHIMHRYMYMYMYVYVHINLKIFLFYYDKSPSQSFLPLQPPLTQWTVDVIPVYMQNYNCSHTYNNILIAQWSHDGKPLLPSYFMLRCLSSSHDIATLWSGSQWISDNYTPEELTITPFRFSTWHAASSLSTVGDVRYVFHWILASYQRSSPPPPTKYSLQWSQCTHYAQ